MSFRDAIKICIMGDSGIGKTMFATRFKMGEQFVFSKTESTIGADFVTRKMALDGTEMSVQLWDMAGQARFQYAVEALMIGSDAGIVAFDCTSPSSYAAIGTWRSSFLANCPGKPCLVIATKCDLAGEKFYGAEELRDMKIECMDNGHFIDFFETSARTADNVDAVVGYLARIALQPPPISATDLYRNVRLIEDGERDPLLLPPSSCWGVCWQWLCCRCRRFDNF